MEGKVNGDSTTVLEVSVDQPLKIDDHCDVRWKEGDQILPAKVIERRPLNYRKRKNKKGPMPDVEGLKPNQVEYYIHYVGQDR